LTAALSQWQIGFMNSPAILMGVVLACKLFWGSVYPTLNIGERIALTACGQAFEKKSECWAAAETIGKLGKRPFRSLNLKDLAPFNVPPASPLSATVVTDGDTSNNGWYVMAGGCV
jgi:hypothetical protein